MAHSEGGCGVGGFDGHLGEVGAGGESGGRSEIGDKEVGLICFIITGVNFGFSGDGDRPCTVSLVFLHWVYAVAACWGEIWKGMKKMALKVQTTERQKETNFPATTAASAMAAATSRSLFFFFFDRNMGGPK